MSLHSTGRVKGPASVALLIRQSGDRLEGLSTPDGFKLPH